MAVVVVRAAAQMVVRRRSRAPGRRARRLQRTVDHVAARPLDDRVDAGGSNKIEGPRVDAGVDVEVRQAAVGLLDDRRVVGARVVHQKGLEDATGFCRAVNGIEGARAVTGADKCGLHGLRIRAEAIEAGSPS